MAEALGLASSIISIVELTGKIIGYAKDVKNAPEDCRKISHQLQLLENLVQELNQRMQTDQAGLRTTTNLLDQPVKELAEMLNVMDRDLQSQMGKTRGSHLTWPFKHSEMQDNLVEIERFKSYIQLALQNDHAKLLVKLQEDIAALGANMRGQAKSHIFVLPPGEGTKVWQEHERREALDWLSPLNFYAKHSDTLAKRSPNTGTWLLERTQFCEWVEGKGQGTLLCIGIPGAGKSVLASIVIDHLQRMFQHDESVLVCFSYCNYKEHADHTTLNLISSLLRQLATNNAKLTGPLTERVMNFYREFQDKKCRPSLAEYSALLLMLMSSFRRVFIIVDALDECRNEDRTTFVSELAKLPASLLITARPLPDILEHKPLVHAPREEVRAQNSDIEAYLQSEMSNDRDPAIRRHLDQDSMLEHDIITKITAKSDGMFLLAHLHFRAVSRLDTRNAIRAKLCVVLDKYICTLSVAIWIDYWLARLPMRKESPQAENAMWLFIAVVIGDKIRFRHYSRSYVLNLRVLTAMNNKEDSVDRPSTSNVVKRNEEQQWFDRLPCKIQDNLINDRKMAISRVTEILLDYYQGTIARCQLQIYTTGEKPKKVSYLRGMTPSDCETHKVGSFIREVEHEFPEVLTVMADPGLWEGSFTDLLAIAKELAQIL